MTIPPPALPWRYEPSLCAILDANGQRVEMRSAVGLANANAALVAALQEALHQIEKYAEFLCEEDFDPTMDQLHAALSLALGEQA